jgi:hypothetical protein
VCAFVFVGVYSFLKVCGPEGRAAAGLDGAFEQPNPASSTRPFVVLVE